MTIDRVAVKLRAKETIRYAKPSMITAGLLYTLLSVFISYLSLRLTGIDTEAMSKALQMTQNGYPERALDFLMNQMPGTGASFIAVLLRIALSIVAAGFSLFVMNTVRGTAPSYGNLLDGFGLLPRLLVLLLLEYVFVILWSLLFVIPGIIAGYRYSMAIYILLDHPEMSAMDCIRESKRITTGYKGQLFILDLSFILWAIASAVPVIGYAVQVYLTPYMETAKFLYYEQLRAPEVYYAESGSPF